MMSRLYPMEGGKVADSVDLVVPPDMMSGYEQKALPGWSKDIHGFIHKRVNTHHANCSDQRSICHSSYRRDRKDSR
jgi:hypothetical protein